MKNLIKIFASLTALTLMTACGGLTLPDLDLDLTGCQANVFRTSCGEEFKVARNRVIADCRTAFDTTGTVASQNCINAAEFVCNDTPFDPLCVDEEYVTIRANTIDGCNAGTEEANICDRAVVAVCGANPYDRFCLEEEEYDDDRTTIQNNCNSEDAACTETTLNNYCTTNPFRGICATPEYNEARSDLSRDCSLGGIGDPRCLTSTVNGVCRDDPFDSACNERYNPTRRNVCVTENTSTRCKATVDRICTANVYDDICTGTTHADSRSATASRTEYETRNCANTPGVGECEALLRFLCTETPLDAFCDERIQYRPARVAECLTGDRRNSDQLCARTVEQVCSANSLEDLCVGVDAYASLQAAACRGESATSKPECTATLTRVCGNLAGTSATGDPFSLTCRNAVFQPAREAVELACVTTTDGRLCQAVRDNTCATTPFDPVCAGDDKYLPLQIRGCIGQEATGDCVSETFFTNSVIRGCLADPTDDLCTASGSAFKPYQIIAQDVACLANGVLANCANPTAVFATLPTSLLAHRKDPTMPHHLVTNPYINGFITIDPSHVGEDGNLVVSFGEGGNFEIATTNTDDGPLDHNALALTVKAGAAIVDNPETTEINETNPIIPGGAVTLRRDSGASDNSDSDDGVAYFATTDPDGNSFGLAYGGILPTTNLGAPLLPQPAVEGNNITAIWGGHVSYRQNPNIQNRPVNFYVDFTAGTIGFANTAETDGTGVVDAALTNVVTNLRLSGKFGAAHNGLDGQPLALGELGGTVGYYFGVFSEITVVPNFGTLNLHGLIGQEGVVGVFLNATIGGTLVGGFTASNPEHPNNK